MQISINLIGDEVSYGPVYGILLSKLQYKKVSDFKQRLAIISMKCQYIESDLVNSGVHFLTPRV